MSYFSCIHGSERASCLDASIVVRETVGRKSLSEFFVLSMIMSRGQDLTRKKAIYK